MGDRTRRSRAWRGGCAVAASAVGLALAGCGGGEGGSEATPATAAREVVPETPVRADRWAYARARFGEMCGGCHTLADARTTGRRFNHDRDPNMNKDRVRGSIRNGEPGMPAFGDVLSRREFAELAAYVLAVARREEGETGWDWQIRLRMEGERWRPGGAR